MSYDIYRKIIRFKMEVDRIFGIGAGIEDAGYVWLKKSR